MRPGARPHFVSTMLLSTPSRRGALCVAALGLAALAGCATTKQKVGLADVDSLVARVEQVQLEPELAKEAVYDTILKMQPIFAVNFSGDTTEAFETFAKATTKCQSQANDLRAHVAPMRSAADVVFEEWTVKLEEFSNPKMRARSLARMEATRERYREVQKAAIAAQEGYDELNRSLRDIVLFLGHDFNAESVQDITEDAMQVRDQARSLGMVFDDCMAAAADYVAGAASRQGPGPAVEVTR